MTHAVAHFLATRVFCIPDAGRIDAAGFADWVRSLAAQFDVGSVGEFEGSVPVTPVMGAVVLGGVPVERDGLIDLEGAREELQIGLGLTGVDGQVELREDGEEVLRTTTSGARKRGKRGARKKNAGESAALVVPVPAILGEDPAAKIQELARELSKQSVPSRTPSSSSVVTEPRAVLTKKPSKWSLFRVRNESASGSGRSGLDSVKDTVSDPSSTATVRSLLGSLEAPVTPRAPATPPVTPPAPARAYVHPHAGHKPSPLGPAEARGRAKLTPADMWGASPIGQFATDPRNKSPAAAMRNPTVPAFAAPALMSVPVPVPHVAAPIPSRVYERASAAESANWRQSTSTVSTSFTHFSNSSVRTVSTVATSVSGSSVVSGKPEPAPSVHSAASKRRAPQSNIKRELLIRIEMTVY
jgi:hypothetical protein